MFSDLKISKQSRIYSGNLQLSPVRLSDPTYRLSGGPILFWNEQKFGHGSRRGPKPRMTVLAKANGKLLLFSNMDHHSPPLPVLYSVLLSWSLSNSSVACVFVTGNWGKIDSVLWCYYNNSTCGSRVKLEFYGCL
jgi:hypothetical protein